MDRAPDYRPLRGVRRVGPELVLACGKVAEAVATAEWAGPLLAIPHPAYRVVTDELLRYAGDTLASWCRHEDARDNFLGLARRYSLRHALRQRRGYFDVENLAAADGRLTSGAATRRRGR